MGKSYLRRKGAKLAVALIEHLKTLGVSAAVGEPAKGVMVVALHRPRDEPKVPKTWNGYKLKVTWFS